jgi:hypothetical protein
MEKLTMDVSLYGYVLRQPNDAKGAPLRVLIEPSLDDPCTALLRHRSGP